MDNTWNSIKSIEKIRDFPVNSYDIVKLDPLIHAPVRMAVLSALLTVKSARFSYLKEITAASDGNLSSHISKLEAAGYVEIQKEFVGKKPQTSCMLTEKGREKFRLYIDSLDRLLQEQKKGL